MQIRRSHLSINQLAQIGQTLSTPVGAIGPEAALALLRDLNNRSYLVHSGQGVLVTLSMAECLTRWGSFYLYAYFEGERVVTYISSYQPLANPGAHYPLDWALVAEIVASPHGKEDTL